MSASTQHSCTRILYTPFLPLRVVSHLQVVRSMDPSTEIVAMFICGFCCRMIPSIAAPMALTFVGICLLSVASLK